jgi:hypothetical protein
MLRAAVGGLAAEPLHFDGGNSSLVVDAYPGTAGGGWSTAWMATSGASGSASVVDSSPLVAGGGNYLIANLLGSDRNLIRQYASTPEFSVRSAHTIEWQWRLDDPFVVNTGNDRIAFFANGTASSASTSASNTWTVGVAPTHMGHSNWYFYDQRVSTGFSPANAFNTGMPLVVGTTYSFAISVDPGLGTYDASISDGTNTVEATGLHFRNVYGGVDHLHFGAKTSQPSVPMRFSLDSVVISGGGPGASLPPAEGFRGIWYYNQATGDEYVYKYSGGFATYPQQMNPQAYYSPEANKTFFCFGGTNESNSTLLHVLSYFDHATGQVARPRILLDKDTTDAHDNPTLMLDDQGYLFVFSNSHGTARQSFIHRSTQPFSIDEFQQVAAMGSAENFSYSQPTFIPGKGFLFLYTHYTGGGLGRTLYFNTSADGIDWDLGWADAGARIAAIPGGQYQISEMSGEKVGTAFNYHPGGNVNARTNLYYMETADMGQTWHTADGTSLTTPVTTVSNAALVHDYAAEGRLVYLKEIRYDAQDRPVLLYLTCDGWRPGPSGGERVWHMAHWSGSQWVIRDVFTTDHNYDFGSLYIEEDGTWRIIAPTEPGPQPGTTGGEMAVWISTDEGASWRKTLDLTYGSECNHTYARSPWNAHDDFYAMWADGNTLARSESHLYFTDRAGSGVWRLPWAMNGEFATPELAFVPVPEPGSLFMLLAASTLPGIAPLRHRRRSGFFRIPHK